ncbi:MAG: single-stranded DNA-binding protein [bacterium]
MLNLKMPDINNVMIAGNLTNDPSFRQTTNGTPVANFYIASNRKFKDNTGQWRENVCFVGVVAWYKLAESCFEFLKKGSAVIVEGELQSRTWKSEEGSNNIVVEIKARRIQFLNRQAKKADTSISDEKEKLITKVEMESEEVELNFVDKEVDVENIDKASQSEEKQEVRDTSDFDFGYEDLTY